MIFLVRFDSANLKLLIYFNEKERKRWQKCTVRTNWKSGLHAIHITFDLAGCETVILMLQMLKLCSGLFFLKLSNVY